VQQSYTSPRTQPKVEERSKLNGKCTSYLWNNTTIEKTWVGQHLHKIEEGFGGIWWNKQLGSMPRVYIRVREGF
jgi:hypothetical protein